MNSLKNYISTKFLLLLSRFLIKKNRTSFNLSSKKKVLLISDAKIQESLAITPLLSILSNKNKDAYLLSNYENKDIFNKDLIQSIILINNNIFDFVKTLIKIKKDKFDIVIDTSDNYDFRLALIITISNSVFRIGYIKKADYIFTHKIGNINKLKMHVIDRKIELLKPLNFDIDKSKVNIEYKPSEESEIIIENYLIKNDLNFKTNVIINLISNDSIGFWGIENYKKLIKYFNNYDISIIVLASIDQKETIENLVKNKTIVYYDIDFDHTAELIKRVDFIFTPDSYVVQLASAYKIPVFCLFVNKENKEIINVPYNSDFDFALTSKSDLATISYGKTLNNLVPFFDEIYNESVKKY